MKKRVPTQLRLSITKPIIACSKPGCPDSCAIANALLERYPSAQRVIADAAGLNFSLPETRKRYDFKLPRFVSSIMEEFDRTGKMKEFSLTAAYRGDKPMGLNGRIVIRHPRKPPTKPYRAATEVRRKWNGVASRVALAA